MSICGEMLTDTEELVSAWQLLGSVKTDNRLDARDSWLLAAESFGCDLQAISDATDDWLLVDWLMRNTDRHYNNFGLIRDVETMQVRPAPLFDTGASLWCGELRIDSGITTPNPSTPLTRRPPRAGNSRWSGTGTGSTWIYSPIGPTKRPVDSPPMACTPLRGSKRFATPCGLKSKPRELRSSNRTGVATPILRTDALSS